MSLVSKSSALSSGRSESTELSVFHDRLTDPVGSRIVSNGLVRGIDEDDFEKLVGGILVDPIGVQDAKVSTTASDSFLSDRAEISGELELVDSLRLGLSVNDTLSDLSLSVSAADSDSVNDVSLLCLVSQTLSLVRSGGSGHARDGRELAVLPAANSEKEAHHIRLLFLP